MTVDQRIWAIVARMTDRGVDGILNAPQRAETTRGRLVTLAAARQAHWARG